MSKLDKDVIISHLESEVIRLEAENAQLHDIVKRLKVEISNLEVSVKKAFDVTKSDKIISDINDVSTFNDLINFASIFAKELADGIK